MSTKVLGVLAGALCGYLAWLVLSTVRAIGEQLPRVLLGGG